MNAPRCFLDDAAYCTNRSDCESYSGSDDLSCSSNECPNPTSQPHDNAPDSTNAGADDFPHPASYTDDESRYGGKATSDCGRGAPNGFLNGSAHRREALAYLPNYSEREAGSASEWANQESPDGSEGSSASRGQPREPSSDTLGEGEDPTGHAAEQATQAPHQDADQT
jgi:hypothetical protein